MLDWLSDPDARPLYLAPMAGVTDYTFRNLARQWGADVLVTEFVSAEGILQADERTRSYTEFPDGQRPVGIQLFGADGERLGMAAAKVIDWKAPEFIDINFGCPVNKVVSRNGGSSLLRDCGLLRETIAGVVKGVAGQVPVTAKIRIGWDENSINAVEVCRLLESEGAAAIAIHGRTRAQGYRGEANWDVIAECAEAVSVPVIGNGDLASGEDVQRRLQQTKCRGVMIGRAAMQKPWIFEQAKHYLRTGEQLADPPLEQRWQFIHLHARLAVERAADLKRRGNPRGGDERHALMAMRSRLMAYSRGLSHGKHLRIALTQVESLSQLEDIAAKHLDAVSRNEDTVVSSQ